MSNLWTKQASHFEVQIQVGNSWVQEFTSPVLSEAESKAEKALNDPSVSSYRILAHNIVHKCDLEAEKEASSVIRMPPKMTPTGSKVPCPRCTLPAPVGFDGSNEWVFCPKCDSAFPN